MDSSPAKMNRIFTIKNVLKSLPSLIVRSGKTRGRIYMLSVDKWYPHKLRNDAFEISTFHKSFNLGLLQLFHGY